MYGYLFVASVFLREYNVLNYSSLASQTRCWQKKDKLWAGLITLTWKKICSMDEMGICELSIEWTSTWSGDHVGIVECTHAKGVDSIHWSQEVDFEDSIGQEFVQVWSPKCQDLVRVGLRLTILNKFVGLLIGLEGGEPKGHFTHETESPWPLHFKHSHWWKRRGRSKFTSHYAWGTKWVCECKMDVKSTWISRWHWMDHVSWSLGLLSKITSWRQAQHKTGRPWHFERSQPLVTLFYHVWGPV